MTIEVLTIIFGHTFWQVWGWLATDVTKSWDDENMRMKLQYEMTDENEYENDLPVWWGTPVHSRPVAAGSNVSRTEWCSQHSARVHRHGSSRCSMCGQQRTRESRTNISDVVHRRAAFPLSGNERKVCRLQCETPMNPMKNIRVTASYGSESGHLTE